MMTGLLTNLVLPAMGLLAPMDFEGGRLWMLAPLTAVIAVVYKTTKLEDLRRLPLAALLLWLAILGGMAAVGLGLLILFWLFI